MSSPRSPQLALVLLLGVAACIAVGGVWLARRTETIRLPRDRAALRDFGEAFEQQMRRLERLYESHLRRIADGVAVRNLPASRAAGERIVGVRRLSILHADGAREADPHLLAMKPSPGAAWPEPTFRERPLGLPQLKERLPQGEILDRDAARFGWIEAPGRPLFFWQRRDWENVAIVASIDREEVAATLDEWFRAWLASSSAGGFASLSATGGRDALIGSQHVTIAAAGADPADPDRPDFLLPLRSRFGTWQFASWDPVETRTSFHIPTLAGTSVLALFTALLGLAVCSQQRRALAQAAQRVSFVNRVSHELRTPLTNILLNLDLARETASDAPPEASRRLDLVREESQRLARLIENVLTFSRREQGRLQLQPHACVPAAVIDSVVEQFAPSFARRALSVTQTGAVWTALLLDADALAQILANLLSNAEKYVPGGSIEIASAFADGMLTITVSDEGPGIAARDAERIFEPFARLDQRVSEGASGTGLGLAIARDLANRMGGSLSLGPSVRGASFALRIPAVAASAPAVASAA